jgi:CubicO group peptidase (beta-lactamase class C family)
LDLLFVVSVCALCLAFPAFAQQSTAPVAINAAIQAKLTQDVPALMQKPGIPELSIAILQDGRTVYLRGFRRRE